MNRQIVSYLVFTLDVKFGVIRLDAFIPFTFQRMLKMFFNAYPQFLNLSSCTPYSDVLRLLVVMEASLFISFDLKLFVFSFNAKICVFVIINQ